MYVVYRYVHVYTPLSKAIIKAKEYTLMYAKNPIKIKFNTLKNLQ